MGRVTRPIKGAYTKRPRLAQVEWSVDGDDAAEARGGRGRPSELWRPSERVSKRELAADAVAAQPCIAC